ncbi:FAD-dependent oxidoreductase [Streptosporangium sp. CA-115845]|uniref:FAD-dependent oxidoreductase n=1 Tax=Streptosporangium sp. CA-115845 TaxID=3240071 RepID=UPI003D8A32BA
MTEPVQGGAIPAATGVVVLGSGAAGLSAALSARAYGADVVLLEKGPSVGGTAALSAGVVWVPGNHHAAAAGIVDSREEAIRYITSLSNDRQNPETVASFVDAAPEVLRWLEENTGLRFIVLPYPDYHSENPGALPAGGRSLAEEMFPFTELGPWASKVILSPGQHGRMRLSPNETIYGGAGGGPSAEVVADREVRDLRGWGQALVGALLGGLLERGVEPVTSAHVTELVVSGDRVTGVRGRHEGEAFEISAEAGVVIATGGFDWAPDLVRTYLRGPLQNSVAVRENVGDGLRLAQQVGAELGTMQEAYWTPLIRRPGDVRRGDGVFPRSATVVTERSRPGSIIVNRAGRRFCNEATNYNAIVGAFHAIDPASLAFGNLPAFLVFDEGFHARGAVADWIPGDEVPDWIVTAPTLAELAVAIGVDSEGLVSTVRRFNEHAEAGHDPDFHRGESSFERANGDLNRAGPAANLGPLREPPFYAVEIEVGAFGTRGGPVTDGVGRVRRDGRPVPGLYAAGNAAASVMGMAYPGGGSTLGPALTFGHLAGRHAATGK